MLERQKAEEVLRESEEKFRSLFESIYEPVSIFVGREGRLIEYNKAFKRMFGYTDEELKDKTFLDFTYPDDRAIVLEKYRTKYSEEELPLIYEVRAVNKKGEIIPLEISVGPYKTRGKVIGIEVILRDLTERKKMEEELRESEERLRDLYESVPDALAVYVGSEGRLIECNKAFKEAYGYGYTDEELKDKTFLDFVHPDDRALVLEKYRTKYPEEAFPIIYEIRGIKGPLKKGGIFPIEISVGPYRKKGKIIGINVLHRDITERKEMENKLQEYAEHLEEMVEKRTSELKNSQEALRESEERLKQLIEYAPDGIFLYDSMGNFIDGNKQAEKMIGYKKEELIGKNMLEVGLVPEEYIPKAMESLEKNLRGQRVGPDEFELIRKDGNRITVEISSVPVKRAGKAETIGIARDITERKRMEERLLKSERLAAIGELATMVGHDLRNPLAALKNACYYLKMKRGSSKDEKLKKMFGIMNKEIDYANNIVKDLIYFSRVKKPELMDINLISSIQDALTQLKFPENITLNTKFSKIPTIEADPHQLRRVFHNIVRNGVQAMLNGGELTVSTGKNGDFVEVSFMDTGVGIPEENLEKLFTPLFTTKAQGVGLGLAICKNIVEGHNGLIEVKSNVGRGTTFTVKLPINQNKGGEKKHEGKNSDS